MPEFGNPEAYQLWMGRWGDRLAPVFVRFPSLPKGGHFLEIGCGTGTLAIEILVAVDDSTDVGVEP